MSGEVRMSLKEALEVANATEWPGDPKVNLVTALCAAQRLADA